MKLVKERIHRNFDWHWRGSMGLDLKNKTLITMLNMGISPYLKIRRVWILEDVAIKRDCEEIMKDKNK